MKQHLKCIACAVGIILSMLAGKFKRSKYLFRRPPQKCPGQLPVR